MPEIDLNKSTVGFMPMVRFHWGVSSANDRLYVRADKDQCLYDAANDEIKIWTAVPALEIDYGFQGGGVEAKPVKITIPVDIDPIDKMIAGTYATVTVTILEADFTDLSADPRIVFVGHITNTRARFRGKSKLCEITVHGRKFYLTEVSLGLKATDRCPWFFGDHVCLFPLFPQNAEVTSVEGTIMTVDGLSDNDEGWSLVSGRYTRGFVERDGLRIMIRQHTPIVSLSAIFIMAKAPPQSLAFTWLGENVNCFSGCDKSLEACEFYAQTHRFGGIGLLMPKYDPLTQERPEGGGPTR